MLTIKLIRFLPTLRNYSVEGTAEHVRRALTVGQSQPNRMGLTRRDRHHVMRRSLRSDESGIDRLLAALHDIVVDAVFDIRGTIVFTVETLGVRFVFSKQQRRQALAE